MERNPLKLLRRNKAQPETKTVEKPVGRRLIPQLRSPDKGKSRADRRGNGWRGRRAQERHSLQLRPCAPRRSPTKMKVGAVNRREDLKRGLP